MISPDYARYLAAYNIWQNLQMDRAMAGLDHGALVADRQAFWRSILGTANHLLWGDRIWMARFGVGTAPDVTMADSADLHATHPEWRAARMALDEQIAQWAKDLRPADLDRDFQWYSGVLRREVSRPFGALVVHMFNHQTHHRGQIHAMLTVAGVDAPRTDLCMMPDDG